MTTREINDQKYQIRLFRGLNNIAPLTETTPVPLSLRKKGKVSTKRIANSSGRSPKNVLYYAVTEFSLERYQVLQNLLVTTQGSMV